MFIEYVCTYFCIIICNGVLFQITNINNTSLFTVEANDTYAKADNGMYNCHITLFVAGMDNFTSVSNYSVVSLEGTGNCIHTHVCICNQGHGQGQA